MKPLLFDQNISPHLVTSLADLYPGSCHVEKVGLARSLDQTVWEYARQNGFIIVTKDAGFTELGFLQGFPPKVIWIRRGNCSTRNIEKILRDNFEAIGRLNDAPAAGVLSLF